MVFRSQRSLPTATASYPDGIDPPRPAFTLAWQERESWRLWLTNRLGGGAARRPPRRRAIAGTAWQHALARLAESGGIDPVDAGRLRPTSRRKPHERCLPTAPYVTPDDVVLIAAAQSLSLALRRELECQD